MRIEVMNLSKWYGQVIGVNNLNFNIGPGVTGFLGPNGAGKTTLIRLMTGQLKPSKGTASIGGEPVWNNYRMIAHVGYCPEMDAFWSYHTGHEFVYSTLRMQGYNHAEAERRAVAAIEQVGMTEAMHKRIGGFSKGMRQRIKLAQAIAHDPPVLFLDEPLNGMDPVARRHTMALVKAMGNAGKTVVVSSHVLHEVEEMTDNILLVNHGRLLAEGNIYEIRRLIDTHPLQVTIRCNQVKLLTAKLMEHEDVLSVNLDREKHQVTIETNQPEAFHARLPELALEAGVRIESLWSPDENLQAVFEYLVR